MAKLNQIDERHPSGALTSDQPAGSPGWNVAIPVIRISTCGPFTVEILDTPPEGNPALARYTTLSPQRVHEHDGRALALLRLLSNAEGRFVSKDQLMTLLCQERKASITEKTLQNIISSLRDLLTLPDDQKIPHLIAYVKATRESGDGYQLAAFPLVWLDIDAITCNIEQATLKQRFHDDPFPYWQRAYKLASRGTYLIAEPFSDWAQIRRDMLKDQLRQCVHALSRLSLSRFGEAGEEEVTRMLLSYCRIDPLDEDALRTLLELLCKQGRYQEMLSWYETLEDALDEAGLTKTGQVHTPHPSTAEIAAYARLKQREVLSAEHWASSDHAPLTPATPSAQVVSSTAQPLPASAAMPAPEAGVHSGAPITRGDLVPSHEEGETPHAGASGFDRFDAFTGPLHSETRHLIGREAWHSHILQMVQASLPKKLIVLHGPIGIGKSSELKRLAELLRHQDQDSIHVLAPLLFEVEQHSDPDAALDAFVGMVLHECTPAPFPAAASRLVLMNLALSALQQSQKPLVILLDNAECLLTGQGQLAPCWQTFLMRYLKSQHQVTLILATKEWQDWSGRENSWLAEIPVPPLSPAESVSVLQRLGLQEVSVELLEAVGTYLGGIPLLLEWTAKLVTNAHLFTYWQTVYGSKTGRWQATQTPADTTSQRLQHLLASPSGLNLHLANKLSPMLQCLLEKHLSTAARLVLNRLAVATLPLGKAALQVLCSRLDLLQELRSASLLIAYTNRIQLLPVVAWTVQQDLTPEQRRLAEEGVIEAYTCWLDEGDLEMQEAGNVITELAVLLLTHHRLLESAQLLLRYGWLSFKRGNAPRIARLAEAILQQFDWSAELETWCGGKLLHYFLTRYLGNKFNVRQRLQDYLVIDEAVITGKVALRPYTQVSITAYFMACAMDDLDFEKAQEALDKCKNRLSPLCATNMDLRASLLEKQALIFSIWCSYAEEQGNQEQESRLRDQAIALFQQSAWMLATHNEPRTLESALLKKREAFALNYLGYHLYRIGHYNEALQALHQSLDLQEQGYGEVDGLPACYGDLSLTLIALGRFREALHFDEKAYTEAERLAKAGHTSSRKEVWVYHINRGYLYLRLGRVHEAKALIQEALPHIALHRRIYTMLGEQAKKEIEEWRRNAVSPQHQLDWRWVERYRTLASFDSYWWLAPAGPFTEEEQREWEQSFNHHLDEATKTRLGTLMTRSVQREVRTAMDERREPLLHYPALDIEDVRTRIVGLLQLDTQVLREEPNALVRSLYHDTIEEELHFLYLIQATYERRNEHFREHNLSLNPLPTVEEMRYVFSRVRHYVLQSLLNPRAKEAAEQFLEICKQYGLTFDLSYTEEEEKALRQTISFAPTQQQVHMISVQAAKRFFETVFQKTNFTGWQVAIDPNPEGTRVEQGLRCLFLGNRSYSVKEVKQLLSHELAGHVARCLAGEHSLLGLLGIHSKNSLETEEGLGIYYEMKDVEREGRVFGETGLWFGTLATGLASGVLTPPQTFPSVYNFFVTFTAMYRLLVRPDQDIEAAHRNAQRIARERCLRTFRGVPDLTQSGICYSKDAHYLRGLRKVEKALQEDKQILDHLAVGVVAIDRLPVLQELGIVSAPRPLRNLAEDSSLDDYLRSFDQKEVKE
jgi:tetratricopeptide (TPR) repeat protein/DNA-binding SARP family transcriptional activator